LTKKSAEPHDAVHPTQITYEYGELMSGRQEAADIHCIYFDRVRSSRYVKSFTIFVINRHVMSCEW